VDDSGGTPASLLAQTVSLTFPQSADLHDTTTMGDDWHEFTSGLKGGGSITHEVFYENTASTGPDAVYNGRIGVAGTLSFGDGTVTYACETVVESYEITANVSDMIKARATHRITGAISRT
jgi:hypothetical protein